MSPKKRVAISIIGLLVAVYVTRDATPSSAALRSGPDCDTGVFLNYCQPDDSSFMTTFDVANECPEPGTLKMWCDWLQQQNEAQNCNVYHPSTPTPLTATCDASECYDPSTPNIRAKYLNCSFNISG